MDREIPVFGHSAAINDSSLLSFPGAARSELKQHLGMELTSGAKVAGPLPPANRG